MVTRYISPIFSIYPLDPNHLYNSSNILPVVILNVGKYAPKFTMGFSVMCGFSACEFGIIFVLRYFANREAQLDRREEEKRLSSDATAASTAASCARDEEERGITHVGDVPPRVSLKDLDQEVLEVK